MATNVCEVVIHDHLSPFLTAVKSYLAAHVWETADAPSYPQSMVHVKSVKGPNGVYVALMVPTREFIDWFGDLVASEHHLK